MPIARLKIMMTSAKSMTPLPSGLPSDPIGATSALYCCAVVRLDGPTTYFSTASASLIFGALLPDAVTTIPFRVPVFAWRFAEHDAIVPPLLPAHVQLHGPEPVTDDAVPALQKLPVGAAVSVWPLLLPQAPLTGVGGIRLNVAAMVWVAVMLLML